MDTITAANTTHAFDIPSGKLHDGLNEITLGFDTLANQLWSNVVLFKMEMTECEDDKDLGTVIVIR